MFDFNQALMDFGALVCAARNPEVRGVPDGKQLPQFSVPSGGAARTQPRESRRRQHLMSTRVSSSLPRSSSATAHFW